MNKIKPDSKVIGIVLSGGAARGFAHIGVLEVLQQEKIPIDIIAGTSAGAVVGAIFAWNRDLSRIKHDLLEPGWNKFAPLIDPCFPINGLIKGKKIKDLLGVYIGSNRKFSDLKIPFACVATDIDTGEEVVFDSGLVAEALRASISIPGIFTLARHGGRYLADGGLTTPVPVKIARDMGADFIIAVNVTTDVNGRIKKKKNRQPNIFQVISQSIYIATCSLARSSLENADFVIEPDLIDYNAGDFQKAGEIIKRGTQAARSAVPKIKEILENL